MGILGDIGPVSKPNYLSEFFLLIGTVVLSLILFSIIALALCASIYHVSIEEVAEILQSSSVTPEAIGMLKINQVFTMIGLFVGAVVFMLTTKKMIVTYPGFKRSFDIRKGALSFLLVFTAFPFVSFVVYYNVEIAEMIGYTSETLMGKYEMLGSGTSSGDLLFNIFLMALLPAIAEETLFRGVVQRFLGDWFRKKHLAIFVTALVFATIHGNPSQYIGILILGLVLGYLMEYSGNLVYPMVFHFFNNLMPVIAMNVEQKGGNVEMLADDYTPNILLVLLSLALTIGAFYLLKNKLVTSSHE